MRRHGASVFRCADIYEVKSSTVYKHIYAVDIAYQRYVLEHCGLNITGTYLICINSDYVRGKELDVHGLFKITDVSDEVNGEYKQIPSLLKKPSKFIQ